MPKFIVTVSEQTTVCYFVEAQDEAEAEEIYWDGFPYKHTGVGDTEIIDVEREEPNGTES